MKAFSNSSSEDDGDFNGNDSEEEDYDFMDEQESINSHENKPKDQIDDKQITNNERQPETDKTLYDLDESDSESEDFKVNSSSSESSENNINSVDDNEIIEEKTEITSNQSSINEKKASIASIMESASESDDDNFEESFKKLSNENTETETEYSDIEDLKKRLKSKQNGDQKDLNELKRLFTSIIELIPPYNNASEALSNSIKDDVKAQKITDVATQLLFLGKFNIYSCNIEQLKTEFNDLQKDS